MAGALVSDFVAAGELRVSTLLDERLAAVHLPRECDVSRVASAAALEKAFGEHARGADWNIVIAPEFDGHLLKWCKRVIDVGGRLLGPSLECD